MTKNKTLSASIKASNDLSYRTGFDAGVKAKKDDIAANYDNWKRACDARGISGQLLAIADLAVRQVIYGNESGKRPDEQDTEA